MELSRQRLRPSVFETSYKICPHCHGTGTIRSLQSTSILMLRHIEEEIIQQKAEQMIIHVPTHVALYLLNQKRNEIQDIERRYQMALIINC